MWFPPTPPPTSIFKIDTTAGYRVVNVQFLVMPWFCKTKYWAPSARMLHAVMIREEGNVTNSHDDIASYKLTYALIFSYVSLQLRKIQSEEFYIERRLRSDGKWISAFEISSDYQNWKVCLRRRTQKSDRQALNLEDLGSTRRSFQIHRRTWNINF